MTPAQRRELERLIDEHQSALIYQSARYGATGVHDDALAQRSSDTYRAVRAYLDEVTDYSTAEAVRYTERTPTSMCTCPVREQTVNGVTYTVSGCDHETGPCPAHGQ